MEPWSDPRGRVARNMRFLSPLAEMYRAHIESRNIFRDRAPIWRRAAKNKKKPTQPSPNQQNQRQTFSWKKNQTNQTNKAQQNSANPYDNRKENTSRHLNV